MLLLLLVVLLLLVSCSSCIDVKSISPCSTRGGARRRRRRKERKANEKPLDFDSDVLRKEKSLGGARNESSLSSNTTDFYSLDGKSPSQIALIPEKSARKRSALEPDKMKLDREQSIESPEMSSPDEQSQRSSAILVKRIRRVDLTESPAERQSSSIISSSSIEIDKMEGSSHRSSSITTKPSANSDESNEKSAQAARKGSINVVKVSRDDLPSVRQSSRPRLRAVKTVHVRRSKSELNGKQSSNSGGRTRSGQSEVRVKKLPRSSAADV